MPVRTTSSFKDSSRTHRNSSLILRRMPKRRWKRIAARMNSYCIIEIKSRSWLLNGLKWLRLLNNWQKQTKLFYNRFKTTAKSIMLRNTISPLASSKMRWRPWTRWITNWRWNMSTRWSRRIRWRRIWRTVGIWYSKLRHRRNTFRKDMNLWLTRSPLPLYLCPNYQITSPTEKAASATRTYSNKCLLWIEDSPARAPLPHSLTTDRDRSCN